MILQDSDLQARLHIIFAKSKLAGETTYFLLDLKCQATIHVFASRSKQADETTYFLLGLKCWRDYNF